MWPFRRARTGEGDQRAGRRGEKIAEKFLRQGGYKVLARNYRCPAGEADLIALDGSASAARQSPTIAFVEVKTRADDRYTDPESGVDAGKRRQMAKVAEYYLAHHDAADCAARFDVIAVVLPPQGPPKVRHIVDAF